MSDLQSLETAKTALDKGLITQADFNSVKEGFVAAQKLRAGVDAGVLRAEDYERARDAFFELMGVTGKVQAKTASETTSRGSSQTKTNPVPTPPPPKTASKPSQPIRPKPVSATAVKKVAAPKELTVKAAGRPTSMSGIALNNQVTEEFNNMKAKSAYLWMTFAINDSGTEVILTETANEGAGYDDFISVLEENSCKYGVYDYHYEASEGRSFNKIVFFNWAPDTASVKQKMMFASTKDFLKQSLSGIQVELHCTDYDDLDPENVRNAIKNTLTRQ